MDTILVHGAPEGFDALLIARRRAETRNPILHVCRDDARMARLEEALAYFAPHFEVLRFSAWDCLPYDRVSPNPEIVAERVATLTRLGEKTATPRILLTTVNALVQKVPPRSAFQGATLSLKRGGTFWTSAFTVVSRMRGVGVFSARRVRVATRSATISGLGETRS